MTDFFTSSKEKAEQAAADFEAEKQAMEEAEQKRLNELYSEDDFEVLDNADDAFKEFDESVLDDVNPVLDNFDFGDE